MDGRTYTDIPVPIFSTHAGRWCALSAHLKSMLMLKCGSRSHYTTLTNSTTIWPLCISTPFNPCYRAADSRRAAVYGRGCPVLRRQRRQGQLGVCVQPSVVRGRRHTVALLWARAAVPAVDARVRAAPATCGWVTAVRGAARGSPHARVDCAGSDRRLLPTQSTPRNTTANKQRCITAPSDDICAAVWLQLCLLVHCTVLIVCIERSCQCASQPVVSKICIVSWRCTDGILMA